MYIDTPTISVLVHKLSENAKISSARTKFFASSPLRVVQLKIEETTDEESVQCLSCNLYHHISELGVSIAK